MSDQRLAPFVTLIGWPSSLDARTISASWSFEPLESVAAQYSSPRRRLQPCWSECPPESGEVHHLIETPSERHQPDHSPSDVFYLFLEWSSTMKIRFLGVRNRNCVWLNFWLDVMILIILFGYTLRCCILFVAPPSRGFNTVCRAPERGFIVGLKLNSQRVFFHCFT